MTVDGLVAWRTLLRQAADRLAEAGSDDPDHDARRLAETASGVEGGAFVLALDEPASQRAVAHFDSMLARRAQGEPLQYVLGAWSFRELDLFVDARVLIPRPETEVVVTHALAVLDRRRDTGRPRLVAADLGTGSGAIGLSLAFERERVEVWATDASEDALEVARANLAGLGRSAARVHLVTGSWFEALPEALVGTLDLVVSNPPYVSSAEELPTEVAEWEPVDALRAGPEGTEALQAIMEQAARWLAPGGGLILELAPHQAAAMGRAAGVQGFVDVFVADDLAARPRVLVARKPEV